VTGPEVFCAAVKTYLFAADVSPQSSAVGANERFNIYSPPAADKRIIMRLNCARSVSHGLSAIEISKVRFMKVILVTGMSGAGKSTALAELARRGHGVVDTDEGDWTKDAPAANGRNSERLWREDKVNAVLDEHVAGTLFISGCVENQRLFYPRVDAVVLLTAPLEVLLTRVRTRSTNPYGKTPAERDQIITHTATVEPLLRAGATVEIDTRMPAEEVADELERVARAAR
jgi:broad-specificity NMP kinase